RSRSPCRKWSQMAALSMMPIRGTFSCCARRERPCGGRAAENCDELAAVHSITSSAREHYSLTCALSDHVLHGKQASPNNCPAIVPRPNGPTGPSAPFFPRQGCRQIEVGDRKVAVH